MRLPHSCPGARQLSPGGGGGVDVSSGQVCREEHGVCAEGVDVCADAGVAEAGGKVSLLGTSRRAG